MESERVDQVLSATTPEALQEAVDELHPALNQEEVATVLRKTALPEARTIADLAGRRGIAPLLENPAFEARRVVRAWLDLLTQPQQGDLSISLASALARLASAGMLEADELREIQGILLSRDVKLVAASDALAFHVVQLPLTAAQLRQVRTPAEGRPERNRCTRSRHPPERYVRRVARAARNRIHESHGACRFAGCENGPGGTLAAT